MCVACVHRLCVCSRPVGSLCGALSRCPRVLDCSTSGVSEWTQLGPVWLSTQQCPWQHLGGGGGASWPGLPSPTIAVDDNLPPHPQLLPLWLISQTSPGGWPHSGLLWQLLSQGHAKGGPPGGRGRDKGPGWASRCSAGPIPLEDELQCPLAHVRLAASSAGGPSSKGS